ncbi:MAG: hypothetical protein HY582_05415, partial [Candidatus Omnitrophica bacterium]|nr:hypothetical protein [Candidatus Omnitrophota bacterium]
MMKNTKKFAQNSPHPFPLPKMGRGLGEGGLIFALVVIVVLFSSLPSAYATRVSRPNVLGNASFEEALGSGGADSGNWDNTNRAVRISTSDLSALGLGSSFPDGSFGVSIVHAPPADAAFTFQVVNDTHSGDFVSFSGFAISNMTNIATTGGHMKIEFKEITGDSDALISTVTSDCINTGNASTFTKFTISGRAPAGTDRVVFTLDRCGTSDDTNDVVFDNMSGTVSGFPIELGVEATKNRVPKGGASFVTINLFNQTLVAQNNVQLVVHVPNGLNILDDGTRLNNEIPNYEGFGARYFNLGTIGAKDDRNLSFLIVVSPGAVIGHTYTIKLYARDTTADLLLLSQTRSISIKVIADPFFDEGTVIGKVFDDRNENGIQDEGEKGIPSVRLATEEGIVIKTDRDGKYHIPGVQPGRHLVKIDGHSLPQGTKFVTEETLLIKTTDGLMNKADFAVKLPDSKVSENYKEELDVMVSQSNDFVKPRLGVQMEPSILRIGQGLLEQNPTFSIDINYASVITGWRVEVKDEQGNEIWTGYGLGAPPVQASWSGLAKTHKLIEPGVYAYRLIVKDKNGYEDWTSLQFFKAVSKLDPASDRPEIEEPATGFTNIERSGRRSIPVVGKPSILVRGTTLPQNQVEVNGKTVKVNQDGTFETEIFTDSGTQPVQIRAKNEDGKTVTYREEVPVKDTSFFLVALGEEELGANIFNGNLETVGRDDRFHQGFYQAGRAAYYLKGKVKGKFLVSSRYDSAAPGRQELFTHLDPDHYYPVYGDGSEINYDARDTQEKFYVLVEMDKSYLKYGSYETNFNETELATYNRTLSGLKVHHEVLSTNKYGDSKRGFTVFAAKARSLADHNEFLGTGGSLYYLRNKDVVQGSEQVHVEIRDKLQGITIFKKDLLPGTDYEIDYPQGRIILRKPLSSVSYSDTILSNDILNGSDVYLTVDYEFEAEDLFGDQPGGLRGFTYLGDHLRLGGTALREKRQDADYDLRGVDALLKLGNNTKVSAEYAQSQRAQVRNAVSYNGGLTFKPIETGNKKIKKENRLFDGAWSMKAESKPLKGTELSGYVQQFEPGFSNADLISQKGDQKSGVEARQKLGKNTTASYRYDQLKDHETLNHPKIMGHTTQVKYDDGKYLAVGEYRRSSFDVTAQSTRGLEPIFEREEFKNGIGTKLGYHMGNGWTPYVKGQVTKGGVEPNHQIGGGIEANLEGKGTLRVEEMVGNLGESTLIGFDRQVDDRTNVYTHLKTGVSQDGLGRGVSSTIGSSHLVNGHNRFYTERELSSYEVGEKSGDLAGYDLRLNDKWNVGVSGERSRLRDFKDEQSIKDHPDVQGDFYNVERSAGALELSYLDREALKWINRFELRFDRGDVRRRQWLTSNSLEWKLTPDYTFLGRANKSVTERTSGSGNLDADFLELNTGIAYRPVKHNRLNVITRYTWLQDVGVLGQFQSGDHNGVQVDERSQIFGIEGIYDFSRWVGLAQKFGYKMSSLRSGSAPDWIHFGTFLAVTRLNFHVTRKWDLAAEYRIRFDHRVMDAMKDGW